MADIIRLRGSPHEQTESLLPWYANGTLDDEEAALVEAHLAQCAECRSELEAERVLALRVASTPIDVEHGWALIDRELAVPPRRRRGEVVPLLRRRITIGRAAAAQLAAAALFLVALSSIHEPPSDARYHALGAPPRDATGNAVILFAPETSEAEMRSILKSVDARLVDGPTETGAYVLRVAPVERERALTRLKAYHDVLVAEPIDAGSR